MTVSTVLLPVYSGHTSESYVRVVDGNKVVLRLRKAELKPKPALADCHIHSRGLRARAEAS